MRKFPYKRIPRLKDRCPRCRIHFSQNAVKILWKDAAECHSCGFIWILLCLDEFNRLVQKDGILRSHGVA